MWRHFHETSEELYGNFLETFAHTSAGGGGTFWGAPFKVETVQSERKIAQNLSFFNHKQNNFQQQSNVKHVYPVSGPGI